MTRELKMVIPKRKELRLLWKRIVRVGRGDARG